MLKPTQINNIDTDEWIASFQSAISLQDTKAVHLLLHAIPQFQTIEEMKNFLALSMDAENMLYAMRQELVTQRTALTAQFLL